MSMESDLVELLKTVCPRVHPDLAPSSPVRPFLVWQVLGGVSLRFLDNTTGDKHNTYLQVSAFSETRLEALALIRAVEDAMCASPAFQAIPQSEPIGSYEDHTKLYGALQRYSIWAAR